MLDNKLDMGLIIYLCWISSIKLDLEFNYELSIELEFSFTNKSNQAIQAKFNFFWLFDMFEPE